MTFAKVRQIVAEYQRGLLAAGVTPKRYANEPLTYFNARPHILYMCNEMLTWGPERIEKAFRWLGFIQGVWAMLGVTVDELKSTNQPPKP
jgi:hypothetical protein